MSWLTLDISVPHVTKMKTRNSGWMDVKENTFMVLVSWNKISQFHFDQVYVLAHILIISYLHDAVILEESYEFLVRDQSYITRVQTGSNEFQMPVQTVLECSRSSVKMNKSNRRCHKKIQPVFRTICEQPSKRTHCFQQHTNYGFTS